MAKKREAPATGMKRKLFEGKRNISVELSQKEMAELATEIARNYGDLRSVRDEAAAARKEFAGREAAITEVIERLTRMAESGRGEREAKVVDMAHFERGVVITTIAGTTKIVGQRPITASERQGTLDFVGPPPTADAKDGKKPPKVGKDGTVVGGKDDGAKAEEPPDGPEAEAQE